MRINVESFLAITVALGAVGAVGAAAYSAWDDDGGEETSAEVPSEQGAQKPTQPAPQPAAPTPAEPAAPEEPVAEEQPAEPAVEPSDDEVVPGPTVETPSWEY